MRWPLRTSRTPIGVDLGMRRLKAAQFSRSQTGWRLEAAVSVPRPDTQRQIGPEDVRQLHHLLEKGAFRGTSVVLAVPADMLLTGIMELPPEDSGAPLDVLARAEFARMHKCSQESLEMACWHLPAPARAANTTFVMGVACRHDDANPLLDLFEAEHFDVKRLETQARALAAACRPLLADVGGIAGILDIGWASARLVLLFQHTLVYERGLSRSGLNSLATSLAEELSSDLRQVEEMLTGARKLDGRTRKAKALAAAMAGHFGALVEEMRIPLSYLANQYPDAEMERLLLVGGGAALPGLPEHLASALECDVRVALPSDFAECPESFDTAYGPTLATAVGLGQLEDK